MDARKSTPSIVAIIAAVVSFFTGAILGFVLAIGAILLGVWGFVLAASPKLSGGMLSIIAIMLGVVGLVASLLKALF